MLTALSIRDVVLVEALDLDLDSGLTVLTGETGAGKSIILDALGMALGARGDAGLVRSGAKQAQATAEFAGPFVSGILPDAVRASPRPLVLRGFVADWPLVRAAACRNKMVSAPSRNTARNASRASETAAVLDDTPSLV